MDKLDKLIELLESKRKDLFNFNWSDRDYIEGKKNGLRAAIELAKQLKEDN